LVLVLVVVLERSILAFVLLAKSSPLLPQGALETLLGDLWKEESWTSPLTGLSPIERKDVALTRTKTTIRRRNKINEELLHWGGKSLRVRRRSVFGCTD